MAGRAARLGDTLPLPHGIRRKEQQAGGSGPETAALRGRECPDAGLPARCAAFHPSIKRWKQRARCRGSEQDFVRLPVSVRSREYMAICQRESENLKYKTQQEAVVIDDEVSEIWFLCINV